MRKLYRMCLARLAMKEQMVLTTEQSIDFPQRLRSTYTLWQIGEGLRSRLPKATNYRHRRELLAAVWRRYCHSTGWHAQEQRRALGAYPGGRSG